MFTKAAGFQYQGSSGMHAPKPNHPAPGKAGIASRVTIGHHCPGLPEPGRWVVTPSHDPEMEHTPHCLIGPVANT
jgi:hypothetical protein